MIATLFATHMGSFSAITNIVACIRPVYSSGKDAFPRVLYETASMSPVDAVNQLTHISEGSLTVHVWAEEEEEVRQVCEVIKENLHGSRVTGDNYKLQRIKLEDESDVEQGLDETEQPQWVKSLTFFVRAKKL